MQGRGDTDFGGGFHEHSNEIALRHIEAFPQEDYEDQPLFDGLRVVFCMNMQDKKPLSG
jgi:hypothetical protein